jgi:transcriptional regulator with XRE-family HTH domain
VTVPPHGNRFPERLQHAVDASGLTLEGIQRRLAGQGHVVGRSTLSYWQNGRRLPTGASSIAAVAALEQILKTRPGALIEALAQHPPTRRLHTDQQAVRDRIDRIIGRADDEQGRQPAHEVVGSLTAGRYGALGELVSMEMTIAIRALSDLQRVTFAHGCEPGDDPNLVEYVMLSGGRIGRVTFDERDRVVLGEIIFDRQLRRGESHLYRYELRDANHQRTERYFKVLDMQSAFVAIELTFHPDCLPVQIEEFERLSAAGPDIVNRNRQLDSGGMVSLVRERARRGILGLQWSYA